MLSPKWEKCRPAVTPLLSVKALAYYRRDFSETPIAIETCLLKGVVGYDFHNSDTFKTLPRDARKFYRSEHNPRHAIVHYLRSMHNRIKTYDDRSSFPTLQFEDTRRPFLSTPRRVSASEEDYSLKGIPLADVPLPCAVP